MIVVVGNTAHSKRRETFSDEPAQLYRPEPEVPLSRRELRTVHDVAVKWIKTAVARRNVADSWEITHPSLRAGFTRAEWAKGNIPAVPYPAETPELARWRLAYAHEKDVSLYFALLPRRGTRFRAMAFAVELRAEGAGESRRWLVSAFTPLGPGEPVSAEPATGEGGGPGPASAPLPPVEAELDAIWLLVPVGLLVAVVFVPIGLWALERWRGRRAGRRHPPSLSRF